MTDLNLSIDKFLKEEGLRQYTDAKQFWSWANQKIGAPLLAQYKSFLEERARGAGIGEQEFYEFIAPANISRIAGSFEFGLLHEILQWVEPKLPHEGVILELGCHTGLLSRFYAISRPNAKVIGIDISQSAINTARELAHEKRIENLSYIQADLLNSPQDFPVNIDCIISGRILSELMDAKPRFQSSWKEIVYPEIDENLDPEARAVLAFCQKIISPNGTLLVTERLADYDRLNRTWLLAQETGFIPSFESITPITWTDVAGKHQSWFYEACKGAVIQAEPESINPMDVPLPSKEIELVDNETRILIKGLIAYQTWFSIKRSSIQREVLMRWPNGLEEHIELGETENKMGYVFIGNNAGNYLLTLFLRFEHAMVRKDIEEYINHLLNNGAVIIQEVIH